MYTIREIKLAELRHGKMMIGLFGTAKATEIIGSYPVSYTHLTLPTSDLV